MAEYDEWRGHANAGSRCTRSFHAHGSAAPAAPSEEVTALEDFVSNLDLASGIKSSLLTKLASALTAIETGKTHGACGALQDFISQVTAQSGKKISTADTTLMIDVRDLHRPTVRR